MVAIPSGSHKLVWCLGPTLLIVVIVLAWRVNDSLVVGWDVWLLGQKDRSSIQTGQELYAERSNDPQVVVTRPYEDIPTIMKVAEFARTVNNSYCGESGEQATDISQVAAHFGRLEPYLINVYEEEEPDHRSSSASAFVQTTTIALPFRAYDRHGTPRTLGGDEFVVTVVGKSEPHPFVWKTTVVAHDYGNGTYAAFLHLPADVLVRPTVRVTLLHYYSCYQGFTRPSARDSYFIPLNMGPIPVEPSPTWTHLLQNSLNETNTPSRMIWNVTDKHIRSGIMMLESLPDCPANQLGMDQLSWGIWIFPSSSSLDIVDTCTREAVWVPTVCRLQPLVVDGGDRLELLDSTATTTRTFQFFRVGDSTMPPAGGNRGNKWNIGDPYLANYKQSLGHHTMYIDILKHGVSQAEAMDVLVLSQGLHQLQNGQHNVERAVESVLRMLCQLGTVFPGKLLVQAPVPIQQQLLSRFDLTDTNVNLFKARMRAKITAVNGRLADICRDIPLDIFYCAATDSGDFASPEQVLARFQENLQYTPEFNATSDERELLRYFRDLSASDRESIWGNRRVVYADVAHLLRPRPECYRDHDKIHALRAVDGHYLMDFGHGLLLRQFAALRGKMEA